MPCLASEAAYSVNHINKHPKNIIFKTLLLYISMVNENYVLTRPAISLDNYMHIIQEKLKEYADKDFNNHNTRDALAFDIAGQTYMFELRDTKLYISVRDKSANVVELDMRFLKGQPKIAVKKQNCENWQLESILNTLTPPGFIIKKVEPKSP
jgi:hypothetical protein